MHQVESGRAAAVEAAVPAAVGYWSALAVAGIGIVYAAVVLFLVATGQFVFPPAQWVQTFVATVTVLSAPPVVAMFVALHYVVPAGRRVFSLLGVLFAAVFMAFVSISRFVDLVVVRGAAIQGTTGGLERFMPYAAGSVTLALELSGWGFFLSLGMLCAAFALQRRGIEGKVAWSFLLYAVLGLISMVGLVAGSPLSMVGFVAWGLVLPVAAVLMAIWFGRMRGGHVD